MIQNEKEEEIVKVLLAYRQEYLNELRSDLQGYKEELLRYNFKKKANPPQKIIDYQFDGIGKSFEEHKIRVVNEEIDILEKMDMKVLDELAYIFDSYTFTFSNKEGAPDFLSPWFIDTFLSAPIFNTILYLGKLERRDINWKNFKRDLSILTAQLEDKLILTENFFPLIPVQSEEEILRIFLTRMHLIYLDPQDGIRDIISCLYGKKKKMPKEQDLHMKRLLSEAGYYDKNESHSN